MRISVRDSREDDIAQVQPTFPGANVSAQRLPDRVIVRLLVPQKVHLDAREYVVGSIGSDLLSGSFPVSIDRLVEQMSARIGRNGESARLRHERDGCFHSTRCRLPGVLARSQFYRQSFL